MREHPTKVHKLARAFDGTGWQLFDFPNPDGTKSSYGLTECKHLYDPGICTTEWDDVTCKNCLRKGGFLEVANHRS